MGGADGPSGSAARRPFVDRALTDLALADRAAEAAADRWGLPRPHRLRVGMNALYGCGGTVLRVGHATAPAELAHRLAEVMIEHGVATVSPVDGLAGTFEGVAVTAWQREQAVDVAIDWVAVGRSVRRVHEVPLAALPSGYPVPSPQVFPWWDFEALLAESADLLDEAALHGLRSALDRHAGWRHEVGVGAVVCHGDVHPGNVLRSANGPLLIDWDLLCTAPPAWDHAMLTSYAPRWGGDPAVYRAFADGYGASLAHDPLTIGLARLRNVAATLMRLRAGRTDPVARAEAERRLRHWRDDPGAPAWTAQ
ncbi:MAG TPA: aminoglycoside phosphotransferase family protein [Ilumatobacter sp.]